MDPNIPGKPLRSSIASKHVVSASLGNLRYSSSKISTTAATNPIRVKSPPWGRVSAPAGVAPEALEESLCSSKGYKCCPTVLPHQGGRPASFFSRQRHSFSRPRHSPCWYSDPVFSLTIRRALVNSGGFGLDTWSFTIDGRRLIRGCGMNHGGGGAPEPRPV